MPQKRSYQKAKRGPRKPDPHADNAHWHAIALRVLAALSDQPRLQRDYRAFVDAMLSRQARLMMVVEALELDAEDAKDAKLKRN